MEPFKVPWWKCSFSGTKTYSKQFLELHKGKHKFPSMNANDGKQSHFLLLVLQLMDSIHWGEGTNNIILLPYIVSYLLENDVQFSQVLSHKLTAQLHLKPYLYQAGSFGCCAVGKDQGISCSFTHLHLLCWMLFSDLRKHYI